METTLIIITVESTDEANYPLLPQADIDAALNYMERPAKLESRVYPRAVNGVVPTRYVARLTVVGRKDFSQSWLRASHNDIARYVQNKHVWPGAIKVSSEWIPQHVVAEFST